MLKSDILSRESDSGNQTTRQSHKETRHAQREFLPKDCRTERFIGSPSRNTEKQRIGMFGLLGVLKNPEVQKAVAFAAKFGEEFGRNMDAPKLSER